MSEFKGMKIYMAVDPQEDGSFFIKKSTRDGSLAVFDEESDAVSQVEINTDNTELREGFILSDTRKEKIESEIELLTAIATKHATRADELYEVLECVCSYLSEDGLITTGLAKEIVNAQMVLYKSRIEAEGD